MLDKIIADSTKTVEYSTYKIKMKALTITQLAELSAEYKSALSRLFNSEGMTVEKIATECPEFMYAIIAKSGNFDVQQVKELPAGAQIALLNGAIEAIGASETDLVKFAGLVLSLIKTLASELSSNIEMT